MLEGGDDAATPTALDKVSEALLQARPAYRRMSMQRLLRTKQFASAVVDAEFDVAYDRLSSTQRDAIRSHIELANERRDRATICEGIGNDAWGRGSCTNTMSLRR